MVQIIVCGGHHFGRVSSRCPSDQINSRIILATREREFMFAGLHDLHSHSSIKIVVHFNHRGAGRLMADWCRIVGIPTKKQSFPIRPAAPPIPANDAFRTLLRTEGINLLMAYDDEFSEFEHIKTEAVSLGIEVCDTTPASLTATKTHSAR
jgi:hypothetical protein